MLDSPTAWANTHAYTAPMLPVPKINIRGGGMVVSEAGRDVKDNLC